VADVILDGGNAFSTFAAPTGVTPVDMSGAVFSPAATTSTARTPYLTAVEFTEAGTGVDVSQLVPSGTTGDQTAALLRVIRQASAWADSLCYKTLAPTVDVQAGRYLARDGMIRIPVRMAPLISVEWISTGPTPYQLTPVALSSGSAAIQPPATLYLRDPGSLYCGTGRGFYQLSYVNGYGACTTLAGSAAVGDTTLNVATTMGIAPGMVLTVDDGATTEQVTVSPSYVLGALGPVPLAAPVTNAHAAGAAVSAMPPDIKRAVIALTACLIKTRGSEAFVMSSMTSPPSKTALSESGGIEDFEIATDLLERYRRVW
jgi:hypothetical protein